MKNFYYLLLLMILTGCKSQNFTLKTNFFEGANSNLKRYYEYNTRTKLLTTKIGDSISFQKFKITNKEKKEFISKLYNLNIKENFCWVSLTTLPEYSWKHEIELNSKRQMPKCLEEPVQYEIYESYNLVKDNINKNAK